MTSVISPFNPGTRDVPEELDDKFADPDSRPARYTMLAPGGSITCDFVGYVA